jgi:hypothetical protein
MVRILAFSGDTRSIIANSASDQYEGLLHQLLMEYVQIYDITLCYLFNIEMNDMKKLFGNNSSKLFQDSINIIDWDKPLRGMVKSDYYLIYQNGYKLSNIFCEYGYKLFQNLNSILDFREIIKYFSIMDRYGTAIQKSRKVRKYSIYVNTGCSDKPIEFDSIDELKKILIEEYHVKNLVPTSYTPWDTLDYNETKICELDSLDLLYLYDKRDFGI